jgi:Na+-driven multidrug efflux pump
MIVSRLAEGDASSAVFAAHVVGIRVEAITYLPAVAWGHASAAMVGQSLGAREVTRAQRVGHEAVLQCGLLAAVISMVFLVGARPIYELMHNDQAVREVGIPAFRLLAFFQVPLALSIIYVFALRGAGDTRYPMWCTIFSVIGVRIPVAYLCGVMLNGGLFGAWIGMCADIAVRATLVWWRYARGRWASTVV